MDWQELLIKILIGGIAGAAAGLETSGAVSWNTFFLALGAGFTLGVLNVVKQFLAGMPVGAKAERVGFWKKLGKSF